MPPPQPAGGVLPPLSPQLRDRLVQALHVLRRLQTDLQYAALAGVPVQPDLDRTNQSIDRLQRLYQAYFYQYAP